jgi:hypothetical protein
MIRKQDALFVTSTLMTSGLVIVVVNANQKHVHVMTKKNKIQSGRYRVTTRDSRLHLLLQLYPKTWHKHIKEAFALGYEDAIDTLWENMPELTLGEIRM